MIENIYNRGERLNPHFCDVVRLALLVARIHEALLSLNAFALFSLGVRDWRHVFRQLSSDPQRAELSLRLNRLFPLGFPSLYDKQAEGASRSRPL